MLLLLLLCLSPRLLTAADDPARFNSLGHKMICGCGVCKQILLECNHVGCTVSDGMRSELSAAIQRGDSDDLVLQAFVQKYGPTILAAPTATGFNRIAWIMPFFVLFAGFASAVTVIRRWKSNPAPLAASVPAGAPISSSVRDEIRRETDL